MRHLLPLVLLALAAFVCAAPTAQADTITYAFTGETYGAGIAFSGTFSYSADRNDWDPTTNDGPTFNYWVSSAGSLVSWDITIAGTTFTRAGAGLEWLGVGDDAGTTGSEYDYFAVRGDDSRGQRFDLQLDDYDATVFDASDLVEIPTVLPYAAFSGSAGGSLLVLDLVDADDNLLLYDGYLTSLNPVPEPATLALLGAGLAGLGLHRRRRRRA